MHRAGRGSRPRARSATPTPHAPIPARTATGHSGSAPRMVATRISTAWTRPRARPMAASPPPAVSARPRSCRSVREKRTTRAASPSRIGANVFTTEPTPYRAHASPRPSRAPQASRVVLQVQALAIRETRNAAPAIQRKVTSARPSPAMLFVSAPPKRLGLTAAAPPARPTATAVSAHIRPDRRRAVSSGRSAARPPPAPLHVVFTPSSSSPRSECRLTARPESAEESCSYLARPSRRPIQASPSSAGSPSASGRIPPESSVFRSATEIRTVAVVVGGRGAPFWSTRAT